MFSMSGRRRLAIFIASMALALPPLAGGVSSAAAGPGFDHNPVEDSSDVTAYAELHGLTHEVAAERLAMEGLLDSASDELRRLAGSSLAGMYVQHTPDLALIIRTVGEAPHALRAAIRNHELPITLHSVDGPTLMEIERILTDTDWRALDDRIQGAYGDEKSGRIVVQLLGDSDEAATLEENFNDRFGQRIRIVVESIATPGEDANRGGRILTKKRDAHRRSL